LSIYKNIKISEFSYDLPEEKIAKYPLSERDKSKLLVWKNKTIQENSFENCIDFIPENSLLVFNNTRVIHARLFFRKETGAKIEIFCLEPVQPADYQISSQQKQKVIWKCMVGNSKKWKSGNLSREIIFDDEKIKIEAKNSSIGQYI